MVRNKSIVDTVNNLLLITKNKQCTNEEFQEILELINEHSDHPILGRLFGYSVSDYAYVALKQIALYENTFLEKFNALEKNRQDDIITLEKLNYCSQI